MIDLKEEEKERKVWSKKYIEWIDGSFFTKKILSLPSCALRYSRTSGTVSSAAWRWATWWCPMSIPHWSFPSFSSRLWIPFPLFFAQHYSVFESYHFSFFFTFFLSFFLSLSLTHSSLAFFLFFTCFLSFLPSSFIRPKSVSSWTVSPRWRATAWVGKWSAASPASSSGKRERESEMERESEREKERKKERK